MPERKKSERTTIRLVFLNGTSSSRAGTDDATGSPQNHAALRRFETASPLNYRSSVTRPSPEMLLSALQPSLAVR